ncbi:alanyl-tRNA synthetase [Pyrolobus fumarii 1A]|uniref:Alanine--tRNA ligase n=1 Tax=Pyrolobus fumarii (strain DSM 11204 / 1A) TaxID=694429 RepID=G0EEM5_PYRF1|nr:alanine--tRNA ligase [Pyrolobus fumarii]AEM38847.1 alanyl-tRNA synthetase [Pyrolobus fumarii 1A]
MTRVDPSVYRLKFFKERGFHRKQCKVCNEYFWTLSSERETCGDAPCEEYRFWDIPRSVPELTLREAIEKFLRFFERHGHTIIPPRPVVARWREDLYLTIASIVVFQPHVTSGLVPPPANPLVIAQPCIRLEDIDHVGLTVGRHLTGFTMGGHHAFNYPDKHVYWKDETVEYAFEFFTKELGIPEEEIVFKESWWEGGGNAGPSFEVTVGGLELATLVFMQYEVRDGKYVEMPLRVVDTGYGLERITWFSNRRAPTAFHAIYRELVPEFFKVIGVDEPEEKLLWSAARLAGYLDPESPESIKAYYEKIASALGADVDWVKAELEKAARVYALLDHTRTIMWMLGDGIVPSNSGEGYLARLVIRRAVRLLALLGSDASLVDLVERQLRYWRDLYPQYVERSSYILEVTGLEEEKYRKILTNAEKIVEKMLAKKRSLSLDDLILLYDSHGIPPDIVAGVAAKRGVAVSVPHDFYAKVAERHGARGGVAREVEKTRLPREVVEWADGFPETRRLFHEDPYMRRFEAIVLGVNGNYVVLDATAFYPTGGGQLHDTGTIYCDGREYHVKGVEKTDKGVIVHIVEPPLPSNCVGKKVLGIIDWERRYRMMRHHTATHILLAAARRLLGDHVWQAGAEKTPEKGRLDITHYKPLSREEVKELEEMVNRVIRERRPVKARLMEWNEAVEKYGYRIFQGGVPPSPKLRIVEIEDWDVEACFGTHLSNTGEVGAFKIINVERIQDGVVRLEYVAGDRVAEYASNLEDTIMKAVEKLGGRSIAELNTRLAKLVEEHEEAKRMLGEYRRMLAKALSSTAAEKRLDSIVLRLVVVPVSDDKLAMDVLEKLEEGDAIAIVAWPSKSGYRVQIATRRKDIDLRPVAKVLRELGGKGGGRGSIASGIIPADNEEKAKELIEKLAERLVSMIKR